MPTFGSEICLITGENRLEDFLILWYEEVILGFKISNYFFGKLVCS